MKQVFLAKIKDGSITFETQYNTARFRQWAKEHPGQQIRIEEVLKPVSEDMRGYYFAAVIPVIRSTCDAWKDLNGEQMHDVMKKMLFYFEAYNPKTGRTERFGRSVMSDSNWNNTRKATAFLEQIEAYLTSCGLEMPSAEEFKHYRDSAPMR